MSENLFDTLETGAPEATAVEASVKDSAAKAARKEQTEKMRQVMIESLNTDPTLKDRLHKYSSALKVVNTLGFGEGGNIIVDPNKAVKEDGTRNLIPTSKICGYRLENIGTEPIKYPTKVWTKGEDGQYVGQSTEAVLNPGETCNLDRYHMAALCVTPEISMVLANGRLVRNASTKSKSLAEELNAHYFMFPKDSGVSVNSDEVKKQIAQKVGDKWVVLPEFEATFGYLMNESKKKGAARKAKTGADIGLTEMAANFMWKRIQEEGL